MLQEEIFSWNGISVRLKEDVFKAGTDAILLASWIPSMELKARSILDAGTGSGILALLLSLHFPAAKIVAIDNDPNAISLAQENFRSNGLDAKLMARQQDVFSVESKPDTFEMVVCNPPFYFNQYKKEATALLKAKHADHPAQDWMHVLSERMEEAGGMYIIVPFQSAFEWIRAANQYRLYCQHRLDVFTTVTGEYPSRSLLHFGSVLSKPVAGWLKMYEKNGSYSQEYQSFSGMMISG